MLGVPLAALLLVAGAVDANLGVVAESRAGEQPITPGQRPEAFVADILTPTADVRLRSSSMNLQAAYGLRIYWQEPNILSNSFRPLLLHSATLSGSVSLSRRVIVTPRAAASIGDADYSLLPQLIGGPELPKVVDLFTASAGTGVQIFLSRRWQLQLSGEVDYRRPLNQPSLQENQLADQTLIQSAPGTAQTVLVGEVLFPVQTTVPVEIALLDQVTRRDAVGLVLDGFYGTYSTGAGLAAVVPQLAWQTHLTPRYDLRLVAGVSYNRDVGQVHVLQGSSPISPVGSLTLETRLPRIDGHPIRGTFKTGVDYYVDPVLAVANPRAYATLRFSILTAPDWLVGFETEFSTDLRSSPLGFTSATTMSAVGTTTAMPGSVLLFDETAISAALPVRHRLSTNLIVETGVRYSDRAPLLWAQGAEFHQRSLFLYVLLSGATRKQPRWETP